MVQELLNNIPEHFKAATTVVQVSCCKNLLSIMLQENDVEGAAIFHLQMLFPLTGMHRCFIFPYSGKTCIVRTYIGNHKCSLKTQLPALFYLFFDRLAPLYVVLLIFQFPCIYKEFPHPRMIVLCHQTINHQKMKKNILLIAGLLLALFVQNNANAQSTGFDDVKGSNMLNAGIGLGSYGLSGTGGLPLVASFEHGVSKNISAGVEAGFIQQKFSADWKYTYLIVGARGSYHFSEALKISNPNLDVYGGAGLLYRHFSFKYQDKNQVDEPGIDWSSSGGDLTIDLHAGARYMFNGSVGGFAELGYGISPLKLGVSFKF